MCNIKIYINTYFIIMKILSIDVGMKNLAYCMFYIDENIKHEICQWDVIDICTADSENDSSKFNCCATLKKKRKNKKDKKDKKDKKIETNICNKKAKYCKNNKYYCKTHAKQEPFIIPTSELSIEKTTLSKLKRKNVNELYKIINGYNIKTIKTNKKNTKNEMIQAIHDYIQENFFNLVSRKTINASQIDLVTIGKNMMNKFDILLDGHTIDYVLIENQISPIANRMKTLQGMITQYFIMKDVAHIEFISASNKLKHFINKKTTYDERKKLGIEITKNILEKNIFNNEWMDILEKSKKKDDLADSLLQGLWYMINNKIISKELFL